MKKIIYLSFILLLFFTVTACSTDDKNVSLSPTGEADTRIQDSVEKESSEDETEENFNSDVKILYGENSGTDKTLTGLEPLQTIDYTVIDANNTKGLSTEKICHSFGVAKNEIAHEISQNSQKHFDDNGFDALTLDTITEDKVIYLTFDVGYDNGYTDEILDTLKEKNVSAAFFCTVDEMESDPDSIARMITDGHIVGNHTDTHPSMDELSRTQMMEEVKAFDDYIRTKFGYSARYFRFPKGEYSDSALDLVGSLGYTSVFWSLAYSDWDTSNQKGAKYALDTVMSRIHPGAVILLHAVSSDNAEALGAIIDEARNMGYEFRSLEEYKK